MKLARNILLGFFGALALVLVLGFGLYYLILPYPRLKTTVNNLVLSESKYGFDFYQLGSQKKYSYLSPFNDFYIDATGRHNFLTPEKNAYQLENKVVTSNDLERSWLAIWRKIKNFLGQQHPTYSYSDIDLQATYEIDVDSNYPPQINLTEKIAFSPALNPEKIGLTAVYNRQGYIIDPQTRLLYNSFISDQEIDFFQRAYGWELSRANPLLKTELGTLFAGNYLLLVNPEQSNLLLFTRQPAEEIYLNEDYQLLNFVRPIDPQLPTNFSLSMQIFSSIGELEDYLNQIDISLPPYFNEDLFKLTQLYQAEREASAAALASAAAITIEEELP